MDSGMVLNRAYNTQQYSAQIQSVKYLLLMAVMYKIKQKLTYTSADAPGTWIFRLGNANIDSMKIYSKDLLATAEVPGVSKRGYETTAAYSKIHNITKKSLDVKLYSGGKAYTVPWASYSYDYVYNAAKPHVLAEIQPDMNLNLSFPNAARIYGNDANGNNLGYSATGRNRQIDWDEENRIRQITDIVPGVDPVERYWYDHKGERKLKYTNYSLQENLNIYINQFASVWVNNGTGGNPVMMTKNYYLGSQRIASRVLTDNTCTPVVNNTYYYGTDHLGSSTLVTDDDGVIKEHVEYTPWGEQWYQEDSIAVLSSTIGLDAGTQFKFTGKELDRTGLYYFGARYYDPQVSLWMSTDPILNKYLPSLNTKDYQKLPSMGGVYNQLNLGLYTYADSVGKPGVFEPKNLGLYTYCHQNPVKMIDPDGNAALYFSDKNDGILTQAQATSIGKTWKQAEKNVQGAVILACSATIAGGSLVAGAGLLGAGEIGSGVLSLGQGAVGTAEIAANVLGGGMPKGSTASMSLAGVSVGLLKNDPKLIMFNYLGLAADLSLLPSGNNSDVNTPPIQPFSDIVNKSIQNDAITKGNINKKVE